MSRNPWFAPFETPGRTGQIAVQRAGGEAICPCKSIESCPCGRPVYIPLEVDRDCP